MYHSLSPFHSYKLFLSHLLVISGEIDLRVSRTHSSASLPYMCVYRASYAPLECTRGRISMHLARAVSSTRRWRFVGFAWNTQRRERERERASALFIRSCAFSCVSRALSFLERKYTAAVSLFTFSFFFFPSFRRKRDLAARRDISSLRVVEAPFWGSHRTSAAFVPGKMTEIFV